MKKKVLMLLAVMIIASTTVVRAQAQNSSAVAKAMTKNDSLVQNLAQSINALIESKMMKNSSDTVVKVINESSPSSNGLSVSDRLKIEENMRVANDRSYGITTIDLDHGDYLKKYDGWFAGGFFRNSYENLISPRVLNHIGSSKVQALTLGYEWGIKTRKFDGRNWWLTKSFKSETSLVYRAYNTNEYQVSVGKNYVWKFAHDFITLNAALEGGVISAFKDSTMVPYLNAGVEASVFCIYGGINWTYSDYCKYKSNYTLTDNIIPTFQLGIVSPYLRISKDFAVGVKLGYCKYAIAQKGIPYYDEKGNVALDVSNIVDTDLYKANVSFSDHYGNILQFGVTTWDAKNFYPGLSGKFNLRNIGRYF